MDPSTLTQGPQHQQDLASSQAYNASQLQANDPIGQSYYAYNQYYEQHNQQQQQQQQYPYYYPDYSNAYPPQPQMTSQHVQGQSHLQNYQNSYYPNGYAAGQQKQQPNSLLEQQWQVQPMVGGPGYMHPQLGQSSYRGGGGGGRRGGRPSFRGGRGRGRGGAKPPGPVWPPRMAWCELCRVDCNTLEILEQHKNGKRHKKNLQVFEELQKINNKLIVSMQNPQMSIPQTNPETSSEGNPLPSQNCPPQPVTTENKGENVLKRGRGAKKNTRGGKRMRTSEPKVVKHIICELCNIKCESQVVFESHLAGKKHLSQLKKVHGRGPVYGLQAIYPPNTNPDAPLVFTGPQSHESGEVPQSQEPALESGLGTENENAVTIEAQNQQQSVETVDEAQAAEAESEDDIENDSQPDPNADASGSGTDSENDVNLEQYVEKVEDAQPIANVEGKSEENNEFEVRGGCDPPADLESKPNEITDSELNNKMLTE